MSRGRNYTEDELNAIREVIKDNQKAQSIRIAEKVKRYGLCQNRPLKSLAAKVSELKDEINGITRERRLKPVVEAEQLQISDQLLEILKDAIIGKADGVWDYGEAGHYLNFSFKAINKVARNLWPDQYKERVRKLLAEGKIKGGRETEGSHEQTE